LDVGEKKKNKRRWFVIPDLVITKTVRDCGKGRKTFRKQEMFRKGGLSVLRKKKTRLVHSTEGYAGKRDLDDFDQKGTSNILSGGELK